MAKHNLRRQTRTRLKQQTTQYITMASQAITHTLTTLKDFETVQHIACFSPTALEPQIQTFMSQAQDNGKAIYLPVVDKENHMHFSCYETDNEMTVNQFGISEPANKTRGDSSLFDWILVPLLCFDQAGNRIGHGAGFYDRFFADNPTCQAKRIGLAFACQEVDAIEPDPWDVPLDQLITEHSSRLINLSK